MMAAGRWRMAVAAIVVLGGCSGRSSDLTPPLNGREVLARMFQAYDGRWYRSLTFTQYTTFIRPDGTRDSAVWYESLKGADRLRIDVGGTSLGNGILFTADSSIYVRDGQVTRRLGRGNPFLPLIQGVYLQPMSETERQLEPFGFALDRVRLASWDGRAAWVVGATEAADTTSAQFWVDAERLVVVRMILRMGPGPVTDARLSRFVRTANSTWLGTYVEIHTGGQQQIERYADWRVNVQLSDLLFEPSQWRTAPHWAPAR